MTRTIASAVFDSQSQAQAAITELRSAGVADRSISLIGRDEGGCGSFAQARARLGDRYDCESL